MMQSEIETVLVPALPGDIDEIYALCRLAASQTETSDWDDEYPSKELLQSDIASNSLYKVMHEGKIISIMLIRPWVEYIAEDEAEDIKTWDKTITNPCALARFCLSPLLQGKGLGRKIMLASLAKAKSIGYDGAFFHAAKDNPLTLHLYDSIGFHRSGEVSEYGIVFVCYEMKL